MVLKAVPPPIMKSEQLDEYVEAIRDVVEMAQTSPTFWTEALAMVGRAANINLKKKRLVTEYSRDLTVNTLKNPTENRVRT